MDLYLKYTLECIKGNSVPMPKQNWMHLGMPNSPNDPVHVDWVQRYPNEYEERKQLFERIQRG